MCHFTPNFYPCTTSNFQPFCVFHPFYNLFEKHSPFGRIFQVFHPFTTLIFQIFIYCVTFLFNFPIMCIHSNIDKKKFALFVFLKSEHKMPTKPTIKSLYNDCFYLNDFRFGIVKIGFQSFLKYEF